MKLRLLAVGQKMPVWVDAGYEDYARRFHGDFSMQLQIINAAKRGANPDVRRLMQKESIGLLKALPERAYCVALAIDGKAYTSMQLAERLKFWQQQASETVFMIGGADGLAPECVSAAHEQLSLSPLTLPHGLARVVLAEQLYRAWSLLNQHPYHRE